MYLKKVEINGFKSFADKTVLEFLPPKGGFNSVTAIVGPNGSGKSNVSDAIRWVMGEQKMTNLRGKKSEDIIFSGSDSKGKMGMASVMMTLDNTDGRAAVDYDELVIGRRIYRSGESEYVINGNVVRLLDLQLLLAKAQFGEGAHAIIGQGMIDRLLLHSAVERKKFFDEAAGIKEFQIKRHQAFLRLRRTKEHIEQAELLLQEVSPRLKTLQRQVKKLEERKELEVTLREKQESYYGSLYTIQSEKIQELEAEIKEIDNKLKEDQSKLEETQKQLAELAGEKSRQDAFDDIQKEFQTIQKELNQLETERAILQGKLQAEYSRSGNHQMGWLETKVDDLKKRKNEIAETLKAQREEKDEMTKLISEVGKKADEVSLEKTQLRSELGSLESKLMLIKTEQTVFQMTGFRAVQAVLDAKHRIGGIHGVVAQLANVPDKYTLALDVAAGGRLASVVVDDSETAKGCVNYLREERLGVATFLPLDKIRGKEVPGYVYDILNTQGVVGLAMELADYSEKYDDVFSFVFGSTIVVEDFDTARSIGIGRVRMVTLQGDLFETSGAVRGGHRKAKESGVSFADGSSSSDGYEKEDEVERKIMEIRDKISSMEIEYESAISTKRQKDSEKAIVDHKISISSEQKKAVETELASLQQELEMNSMSPESYGVVMAQMSQQKRMVDEEIKLVTRKFEEVSEKMEKFNEEEEKKKQKVFNLQDEMTKYQSSVNIFIEQKNSKQVTKAKLDTKQEDLQEELYQELRTGVEKILERGVPLLQVHQLESAFSEVQKMKYKLSLIGSIHQEVVDEYEETKARHEGLNEQLVDLTKAMKDLDALIEELDSIMKKKRKKAFTNIKQEFARYFSILFEGGKADLIEQYADESEDSDPENMDEGDENENQIEVEETKSKRKSKTRKVLMGIDVIACPPGKKIKNIQSLSGGERTMTSIALMCAILKTNPSPFVVLDEVEAALDEANTLRVVNIVKELSEESQFVIITHNRVTMHAADALYGVTMGNDGISKLLSVKMGS